MPFDVSPLMLLAAVAGGIWGSVADRIAARWPEHEDGSVRAIDWRTVVVVVAGALALGALVARFSVPIELAVFGAYTVALILLLATDLDQRLLPDLITLPAIPIAFVFAVSGLESVRARRRPAPDDRRRARDPGGPGRARDPVRRGRDRDGRPQAAGLGGAAAGPGADRRASSGVVWGALFGGVVILVLLLTRRVSLRSYVPFGPFLIAGVLYGLLAIRY